VGERGKEKREGERDQGIGRVKERGRNREVDKEMKRE
jgi:hypothetical protein